ncbi:MAG: hypothetical protein BKP49_05670 [Treponema sp. CETP13]|nr:MAG: hypothetical protein BKP49_05670 [Treponema sp. CETP13]
MNKKRIAVVILCFVVSVFCLTISSCGDRFGTNMYATCYVVVPKEYTKLVCTTTRNVDSDYLDEELMPCKFSEVAGYDLEKTLTEAYPEDENNIFYFWTTEQSFSSTETYVLDLDYQFYDENDVVTECSQNIVIPLGRESLEKTLPSEMAEGIIHIEYNYSQTI